MTFSCQKFDHTSHDEDFFAVSRLGLTLLPESDSGVLSQVREISASLSQCPYHHILCPPSPRISSGTEGSFAVGPQVPGPLSVITFTVYVLQID